MPRTKSYGEKRNVGRLVNIGHSVYVTVPAPILRFAGLKAGDRVAMETDGRSVIFAKIPFDELINRALLRREVAEKSGGSEGSSG